MDGQVIIGTTLDTKDLDRQLRDLEKQLKSLDKEREQLDKKKGKSETDIAGMEQGQQFLVEQYQKEMELLKTEEDRAEAQKSINDFVELTNQGIAVEKQNLDGIVNDIKRNEEEHENVSNEIENTNQKLREQKNLMNMNKLVNGVGKEIEKVTKKIGKWALAVIGIKSIVNFIKSSVSTLSQYDDKMASDLEYIRYALATTIKPLVEWLINAFYQILTLAGYIIKQITGKNIFDNAGAKAFAKDLNKASKSAKELKKQLAGFDEANVLSDNKSTGGGGAGTPSVDLKNAVDNFDPTKLKNQFDIVVEWIDNLRQKFQDFIDDVASIVSNNKAFEKAYGIWGHFVHGIGLIFEGVITIIAGVWDTIVGLFKMVVDILTGDFDSLGEDFQLFINGIWEIIKGFVMLVIGRIETLAGFIYGIIMSIWKYLIDNFINPAWNAIVNFFAGIGNWAWNTMMNIVSKVIAILTEIKSKIQTTTNYIKSIVLGIIDTIKNKIGEIGTKVSNVFNSIKSVAINIINFLIDGMNKFINGMNKIQWDVPTWIPVIGGQKWGVNIPNIPRLAQGGIVNMPNRGVMVGGAIAGESGSEGVIPLTDPYAMAQLGEQIGRWVNLAIDNKMVVDGRVLATATNNQINKENFLMNR